MSPFLFAAFAMASSIHKDNFDNIVSAVSANIERRKKIGTWIENNSTVFTKFWNFEQVPSTEKNAKANNQERSRHRDRSPGKLFGKSRNFANSNKLLRNRVYHYCEKLDILSSLFVS